MWGCKKGVTGSESDNWWELMNKEGGLFHAARQIQTILTLTEREKNIHKTLVLTYFSIATTDFNHYLNKNKARNSLKVY